MRTAVYYSNRDLRIEERPKPKVGLGELLVLVETCGICGSDVMEWYRRDRVPLILGHEASGVIEEAGEGVKKYQVGQRVALAHHVPCGKCHYCLKGHEAACDTLRKTNFDPGGFSEFVRLPKINVDIGVFPLPDKVSFEEATFVEPLACVLRGQRIAGFKKGDAVLVLGCGIAGLLHISLARLAGAGKIIATDIVEWRLKQAQKFGADIVILAKDYTPDIVRQFNEDRLADLVIVTTGALTAIEQALKSVDWGGRVLFFAPTQDNKEVNIPFNSLFWRNEITLTSSYAASPVEYQQALELIAAGKIKVDGLITHRLKLTEIGDGFRLTAEAKESIKLIIYPQK